MAAQAPEALALALPLLESREDTAAAAVEALIRSGRPELFQRVRVHLERLLGEGGRSARMSRRAAAGSRLHGAGDDAPPFACRRIAPDDFADYPPHSALGLSHAR